ncbi:MAG TPA: hypothetical protein VMC80_02865 [Patescibacteria group bacterium]|nr:hypothetical protein [Patescibacteria group bacterium]
MPIATRGMFPDCEKIMQDFIQTRKTLGDYVLKGGIQGKVFVAFPLKFTYEVLGIYSFREQEKQKSGISVVGINPETHELLVQDLTDCRYHREYSGFSQTSPKLTEPQDPLKDIGCPQ